ncbi:protein kinase domain-containing protein [Pseudoxanthomonas suwonensis]|uniref:protein kinase domain-containing protein n=1 Tax=Pseudoxanthomonas suwonensis TaxID=314722 RepID=UPI0009E36C41|nr:protein kinase [Pseudoxanthomonas suwonensis]
MNAPLKPRELIGGRYEIDQYMAEGGMQYVYLAKDTLTGRHVALKTPKNNSAVKRFRRSAIVAAKVNHPNVAKTLDYVREGEARYLIEELIAGEDLSHALLKRTKFLDPYLAARVFHHLAKGVAAAHHVDVVHRDLKPSNVMVSGGYDMHEVKVTDFGIAKLAKEELEEAAEGGPNTMSMSQTAVGALPYMAPEAIETPKEVTTSADIWSLGAMMYHMLTGETPFGSGLRAVRKITAGEISPPPRFLTDNPQFAALAKQVLELSLSCMKREPDERPQADELVEQCGTLCYNLAPRFFGTIRRVEYNKYGFISSDGGDVFFHIESFYGPDRPKVGDKVMFSSYPGGGAPRAYPMVKVDP